MNAPLHSTQNYQHCLHTTNGAMIAGAIVKKSDVWMKRNEMSHSVQSHHSSNEFMFRFLFGGTPLIWLCVSCLFVYVQGVCARARFQCMLGVQPRIHLNALINQPKLIATRFSIKKLNYANEWTFTTSASASFFPLSRLHWFFSRVPFISSTVPHPHNVRYQFMDWRRVPDLLKKKKKENEEI